MTLVAWGRYGHIDKHIEEANPPCFSACAPPAAGEDLKMTTCYLKVRGPPPFLLCVWTYLVPEHIF